jgi:hypothetical protein
MSLVNDRAIFEVNTKGEMTGKVYTGRFTMKLFLTLGQRSKVAVEYSKRDFGNDRDETTGAINKLICEFQALAEECPEWFKGEAAWDLVDYQPLIAIREGLEAAQKEYSNKINA